MTFSFSCWLLAFSSSVRRFACFFGVFFLLLYEQIAWRLGEDRERDRGKVVAFGFREVDDEYPRIGHELKESYYNILSSFLLAIWGFYLWRAWLDLPGSGYGFTFDFSWGTFVLISSYASTKPFCVYTSNDDDDYDDEIQESVLRKDVGFMRSKESDLQDQDDPQWMKGLGLGTNGRYKRRNRSAVLIGI